MKIAVCDDENIFRDMIIREIEGFYGRLDVTVFAYADGRELLCAYDAGSRFDALFLDIEMPELDGMKTAEGLRKKGYAEPIIFLTSHTELAMEGYEVSAFRFLAKPIDAGKLKKTLEDLSAQSVKDKLIISCDGEDVLLLLNSIRYIEAMNNSVSIVTEHRTYTVRKKISDMEQELAGCSNAFFRVHRGSIVNLFHVKKHKGNEIYMSDGKCLPLSRSMAAAFKEKLFAYVRERAR